MGISSKLINAANYGGHIVGDIMDKTITVKVMGKPAMVLEEFEGTKVSEVLSHLSLDGKYTINLGGKPANEDTDLVDGAYIVLSPSVKGA